MERALDRKIYLAYGSNLNLAQMKKRCPEAKVIGTASLRDYQLLFRGAGKGAVATVEPKAGSYVPVLLWDISLSDEKSLDRYEGWPFLYRKEKIFVKYDGKYVETMAYIMNEKGHAPGRPSDGYFRTIMEGYISSGFNAKVLERGVEDSLEKRENEKRIIKAKKEAEGKGSLVKRIFQFGRLKKATNF